MYNCFSVDIIILIRQEEIHNHADNNYKTFFKVYMHG